MSILSISHPESPSMLSHLPHPENDSFADIPHCPCDGLVLFVFQLDHILGRYGVLIIERAGADVDQAIDSLSRWRHNIHLIHQLIQNDVSSTKVRLFLRRGLSVRYLLPAPVVDYIEAHGLYTDDGGPTSATPSNGAVAAEKEKEREKGKGKEVGSSGIKYGS